MDRFLTHPEFDRCVAVTFFLQNVLSTVQLKRLEGEEFVRFQSREVQLQLFPNSPVGRSFGAVVLVISNRDGGERGRPRLPDQMIFFGFRIYHNDHYRLTLLLLSLRQVVGGKEESLRRARNWRTWDHFDRFQGSYLLRDLPHSIIFRYCHMVDDSYVKQLLGRRILKNWTFELRKRDPTIVLSFDHNYQLFQSNFLWGEQLLTGALTMRGIQRRSGFYRHQLKLLRARNRQTPGYGLIRFEWDGKPVLSLPLCDLGTYNIILQHQLCTSGKMQTSWHADRTQDPLFWVWDEQKTTPGCLTLPKVVGGYNGSEGLVAATCTGWRMFLQYLVTRRLPKEHIQRLSTHVGDYVCVVALADFYLEPQLKTTLESVGIASLYHPRKSRGAVDLCDMAMAADLYQLDNLAVCLLPELAVHYAQYQDLCDRRLANFGHIRRRLHLLACDQNFFGTPTVHYQCNVYVT